MAHNLSFVNDKAEMMYVGQTPWHGFGTPCEGLQTTEQVLEKAHLDWEVKKLPLYTKNGKLASGIWANTRMDNEVILGYVGDTYQPLQNKRSFDFFDVLTGSQEAIYETAGAMFQGKRVWIMASLPDYIQVGGSKEDTVKKYLLLYNGHDGKNSVKIKLTPVRVVCWNTLQLAMKEGTSFSIRHSGNMQNKFDLAYQTLGLVNTLYKDIEKIFARMQDYTMTEEKSFTYIESLFPLLFNKDGIAVNETARKEALEKVFVLKESGKGSELCKGTLWGDYNAVVEYVDFHKEFRYQSTRMNNILFDNKIKHDAFKRGVELCQSVSQLN